MIEVDMLLSEMKKKKSKKKLPIRKDYVKKSCYCENTQPVKTDK